VVPKMRLPREVVRRRWRGMCRRCQGLRRCWRGLRRRWRGMCRRWQGTCRRWQGLRRGWRDGASASKQRFTGRLRVVNPNLTLPSPSKHFLRDSALAPKLLSAGRAASPSKHTSRANTLSWTERQPRNFFLPELLSAGHATSPDKYFVGDGASAPGQLSAGHARSPSKYFVTECHPRNCLLQDVPPPRANML